MKQSRQALILFCEDVRFELGDKLSYMGVIGPDVWMRVNDTRDFYCVFLVWAFEPEVIIHGAYELLGAPDDVSEPEPVALHLCKNEGNDADRWLVQVVGKIKVRVEDSPVTVKARFSVGKEKFSNRITFDPIPSDAISKRVVRKPQSKGKSR